MLRGPFPAASAIHAAEPRITVIVPLAEAALPDDWGERNVGSATGVDVCIAAPPIVGDALLARLERRGYSVLRSDAPRGTRLRAAARRTRGHFLLFLHADTRLPPGWCSEVTARLGGRRPWGAFRLAFEDARGKQCFSWIAAGANARTRLFGLPYGDQAPFATREAYESVGGHPPWPFLDDLELSLRLRRLARPLVLPGIVRTSSRRYEQTGGIQTVLRNARILARFARGVAPIELEKLYRES